MAGLSEEDELEFALVPVMCEVPKPRFQENKSKTLSTWGLKAADVSLAH